MPPPFYHIATIWSAVHFWARLAACADSSPPSCWSLPSPPAGRITPRVIGIADGDTITVLTADKVQHRIRLHGIDAPETGQDFAHRAKQTASKLTFGKNT
jgi:endonuclease YncB( thermonuclease family)